MSMAPSLSTALPLPLGVNLPDRSTSGESRQENTSDNSLYAKQLTSQLPLPDNRVVRNLNKSTITQLLTIEKKAAPDFAWFKPVRPEPYLPFDTVVYEPLYPDYWWRDDANTYPFDTETFEPLYPDYWPAADTNIYPFDTQYAPAVAITDPARLLAARCVSTIDTQPLVEAARRKEAELLVKMPVSADCLKHEPLTFAPAPAAMPAVETHAPCTTISTRGMDALLTEIRANVKAGIPDERSQWLIGPSKRWNGAKARA